ncbi:MAG TPA: TetR/AcrR family transcriptional regulator [Gemmatimonadales bacterium]|nr:TetR/AcrR family transcriptional regulator [Gemmatimonadales bacterium]
MKPRWQRRKEARPEEIVNAALATFAEHGFAAARLDDVAARAGVTKGTIYLYFKNKEDLFQAVVRQTVIPKLDRAEQEVREWPGSTAELLRHMVRGWWTSVGKTPLAGVVKLIVAEATNFPDVTRFYHKEVIRRGHRLFEQVLQRGVDSGEFRPVDVPLTVRLVTAPMLMAVVHSQSLYRCVRETIDWDRYVEMHLEMLLRGLSPAPIGELHHA